MFLCMLSADEQEYKTDFVLAQKQEKPGMRPFKVKNVEVCYEVVFALFLGGAGRVCAVFLSATLVSLCRTPSASQMYVRMNVDVAAETSSFHPQYPGFDWQEWLVS